MGISKPISRRGFVKNSIWGGMAAAAALHLPADEGLAALSPPTGNNLRFGANYVPRKRWWYCWQDWDQQAVAEDLSAVADLGLDHVRIQCLWPIFQPGISSVSDSALENLQRLLDAADKAGLDVEVTVLNGWMSGLQYMPAWVAPLKVPSREHSGNVFSDREVIDAEKLLFRRLADTVGRHKRFLGFDIGNELGVLQGLSNPVTTEQADAWATEILRYCEAIAPGEFHVNGADDSHWFADFGFSRENLANTGEATVVHCYVFFTGALDHYRYSEPGSLRLAEYMVELAYAYQNDLGRRVWVEEVGVSPEWMPESYLPEFMERTIRNVADTGESWGITWWSSHDIDPSIKGFASLEYTLGLLDVHNRPKPLGRKLAALAKELRQTPPEIASRPLALVIPDRGLSPKTWPPDWTYAKPYMDLVTQGKRPTIVLESRARDEAYLKVRGIRDLIPMAKVKTANQS
jgi:endo-1,4-beta-mannosidase